MTTHLLSPREHIPLVTVLATYERRLRERGDFSGFRKLGF